ncbi:MAG: polynucleotide adenylyltransferase PcnB [Planctomycetota bacterium]|jgi:poly(A) polymerase
MSTAASPQRYSLPFPRRYLDRRAVSIVRRLQEQGFETYLVGGCVRDLLLGSQPKDFDIATAARPHQVRRLFRRSRLIGRRFKIVHVHQGRDFFEVATFRAAPEEKDANEVEMIQRDNVYGTAAEDANRRDFTVNGLFLDPIAEEIVDWVDGMRDIEAGVLHTIGDPEIRFPEDPVRILRLIKFMRRLDLQPGDHEIRAARTHAHRLADAAPARLAEEVFRLMATRQAEGVWEDVRALGLVDYLLPELKPWLRADPSHEECLRARFRALDQMAADGFETDYAFSLAVLFGCRAEQEYDPANRRIRVNEFSQVGAALIGEFQQRARLPRQAVGWANSILTAQLRLDPPAFLGAKGERRWNFRSMAAQEWFPLALDYLRLRLLSEGRPLDLVEDWRQKGLSLKAEEG